MKYFCPRSVEHRFFLCRCGIIKAICLTWEQVKLPDVYSEIYWILKSLLNCKHTRRRVREVPNFKWVEKEFAKSRLHEERMSTRKLIFGHYIETKSNLLSEMIEKQNNTVTCTSCGIEEPAEEKFKKCCECKLAYFCSKKCLRKNYQETHKNSCIPVSDS